MHAVPSPGRAPLRLMRRLNLFGLDLLDPIVLAALRAGLPQRVRPLGETRAVRHRRLGGEERRYWLLGAAMLLAAEMLVIDFAGWGTAYPRSRESAVQALGFTPDSASRLEWLDYYLPQRDELAADVVKAFGPAPM